MFIRFKFFEYVRNVIVLFIEVIVVDVEVYDDCGFIKRIFVIFGKDVSDYSVEERFILKGRRIVDVIICSFKVNGVIREVGNGCEVISFVIFFLYFKSFLFIKFFVFYIVVLAFLVRDLE